MDCETAILLRMYEKGLVGSNYRSIQNVRRSIGWAKIEPRFCRRKKFDAIARKLLRKELLSDAGKSASVLSLSVLGYAHVRKHLDGNQDALNDLDAAVQG